LARRRQEEREHDTEEDEAGRHEAGRARRADEGVLDRLDRPGKRADERGVAETGCLLRRERAYATPELFTRRLRSVPERWEDLPGGLVHEVGDQPGAGWRHVGDRCRQVLRARRHQHREEHGAEDRNAQRRADLAKRGVRAGGDPRFPDRDI
jgi:hypothetical protein